MAAIQEIQDVNYSIMFGSFTNDQLNSIISAVKFARAQLVKQAKNSFTVGSKVKFASSKSGKTVIGEVEKVNRKFIIVREKSSNFYSMQWRVPANMLEMA